MLTSASNIKWNSVYNKGFSVATTEENSKIKPIFRFLCRIFMPQNTQYEFTTIIHLILSILAAYSFNMVSTVSRQFSCLATHKKTFKSCIAVILNRTYASANRRSSHWHVSCFDINQKLWSDNCCFKNLLSFTTILFAPIQRRSLIFLEN